MLRKILFWTHLVLGLSAGVVIAIMSFTGAALAFEKELIAWAERDARRVEPAGPNAARLSLDEIVQRVRVAKPAALIANLGVATDPAAAIAVGLTGNTTFYVNPFTGEVREGRSPRMRAFMQTMRGWHTRLNFTLTPGRPTLGAKLNAAGNLVFLLLCCSGLLLWWPRVWNARVLRPSLWFVREARGKARDWNWHNVFGFWSLPALIVLAGSGVVLSYGWAGDLVFRLAGEEPPLRGAAQRPTAGSATTVRATADSPQLSPAALIKGVQTALPAWELITLRYAPPLKPVGRGEKASTSAGVTAVVRTEKQWPPFAATTLTLDPQTGAVRRAETFAELSTGQRARRWIRLLHTGEAFRWPGELIAGVACLAGCILVWTGVSLAWRRFFGRSETRAAFVSPEGSG